MDGFALVHSLIHISVKGSFRGEWPPWHCIALLLLSICICGRDFQWNDCTKTVEPVELEWVGPLSIINVGYSLPQIAQLTDHFHKDNLPPSAWNRFLRALLRASFKSNKEIKSSLGSRFLCWRFRVNVFETQTHVCNKTSQKHIPSRWNYYCSRSFRVIVWSVIYGILDLRLQPSWHS